MAVFSVMLLFTSFFATLFSGSLCAPRPFLSSGALPSSSADVIQQLNKDISQIIKNVFREVIADAGNITDALRTKIASCLDGSSTECSLSQLLNTRPPPNTSVATSTTTTTARPAITGPLAEWINISTSTTSRPPSSTSIQNNTISSTATTIRTGLAYNVTATVANFSASAANSSLVSDLGTTTAIQSTARTNLAQNVTSAMTTFLSTTTSNNLTNLNVTSPTVPSPTLNSSTPRTGNLLSSTGLPVTVLPFTANNSSSVATLTTSAPLSTTNSNGTLISSVPGLSFTTTQNGTTSFSTSMPPTTSPVSSMNNSTTSRPALTSPFTSNVSTITSAVSSLTTSGNGTVFFTSSAVTLPTILSNSTASLNFTIPTTQATPSLGPNSTTTKQLPLVTPSGNLLPWNQSFSPLLTSSSSPPLTTNISAAIFTTLRPQTANLSAANISSMLPWNVSQPAGVAQPTIILSNLTTTPTIPSWINASVSPTTGQNFSLINATSSGASTMLPTTSPAINITTPRPTLSTNASVPASPTPPTNNGAANISSSTFTITQTAPTSSSPTNNNDRSTTSVPVTSSTTTGTSQRSVPTTTSIPITTSSVATMSGNIIQLPALTSVIPSIVDIMNFVSQVSAVERLLNFGRSIFPTRKSSRIQDWGPDYAYSGDYNNDWNYYYQKQQAMLPPACDCYEAFHGSGVSQYVKSKREMAYMGCMAQLQQSNGGRLLLSSETKKSRSRTPRQANWMQKNQDSKAACHADVMDFVKGYEARKMWLNSLGPEKASAFVTCYGQQMDWLDKDGQLNVGRITGWIADSSLQSLPLKKWLIVVATDGCLWLKSDLRAYMECVWQPCFAV